MWKWHRDDRPAGGHAYAMGGFVSEDQAIGYATCHRDMVPLPGEGRPAGALTFHPGETTERAELRQAKGTQRVDRARLEDDLEALNRYLFDEHAATRPDGSPKVDPAAQLGLPDESGPAAALRLLKVAARRGAFAVDGPEFERRNVAPQNADLADLRDRVRLLEGIKASMFADWQVVTRRAAKLAADLRTAEDLCNGWKSRAQLAEGKLAEMAADDKNDHILRG